uniref:Uncharacterized protein n=1 Tax=Leersia perrieri TaxID=77586 RepID=A0A0D9XS61_9ORYZ
MPARYFSQVAAAAATSSLETRASRPLPPRDKAMHLSPQLDEIAPAKKRKVLAMASSSSWSDLRPELLDIVLHCLHFLANRIRF